MATDTQLNVSTRTITAAAMALGALIGAGGTVALKKDAEVTARVQDIRYLPNGQIDVGIVTKSAVCSGELALSFDGNGKDPHVNGAPFDNDHAHALGEAAAALRVSANKARPDGGRLSRLRFLQEGKIGADFQVTNKKGQEDVVDILLEDEGALVVDAEVKKLDVSEAVAAATAGKE